MKTIKMNFELNEEENRVIGIVKAQHGFSNKNKALEFIIRDFGACRLEPQLRPKFVEEIEEVRKNGKFVKVDDFAREFGLKK